MACYDYRSHISDRKASEARRSMSGSDLNKVGEILEELIGLDRSERARFLDNADLRDEVRREVEQLLSFEEDAADSFNLAAIQFSKDFFDADSGRAIGQIVDVYRITGELGTGGMGAVFLAERQDGKLDQKVALKLLKRELNTAALRARFGKEREILASLEHPSIGRLLNAGTSEDGIPYLAIEYVDGMPMDEYCNRNSLGLEERLKMFVGICRAVGYAHRNLVVHRDLKPSNILVDKNGTPKLLDFGISKILSDESDNADIATVTRMGVMTPSYASPEQLKRESVTTATDIYSLGVVLYELVSGVRPFAAKEDDLKAIYSAVIEESPATPSEAARTGRARSGEGRRSVGYEKHPPTAQAGEHTSASAASKTAEPGHPVKWHQLKGDLDTIILKAVSKEPERRYSSVEAFADDIERYLRGLPVLARPDSVAYRTGKFLRRHAVVAGAGFLLLLAVVVGLGATLWQARQTQIEAERARLEAEKRKEALDFVGSILNFANPFWHSPNPERKSQATVAEAMDLAVQNAETKLADKPEVQAEIYFILGKAYMGKGDYKTAERMMRQAIANYDSLYGSENVRSMHFRGHLANQLYVQGQFSEAGNEYRRAVEYLRPRLGEHEETKVFLAGSVSGLGNIVLLEGDFATAAKMYEEALSLATTFEGDDRRMVPVLLGNLGTAYSGLGQLEKAEGYLEQALEEVRSRGSIENTDGANFLRELGLVALMRDDLQRAEKLLQQAHGISIASLGERSIYTLDIANHLIKVYLAKEDLATADRLLDESQAVGKEVFPNGNAVTLTARMLRGDLYTRRNQLKEGEAELRAALDAMTAKAKQPNAHTAIARAMLGKNLAAQNRYAEARDDLTSAFETLSRSKGASHPDTVVVKKMLDGLPVQ